MFLLTELKVYTIKDRRFFYYFFIKSGRKWKVVEAVDEAKECLKINEVIGQTQADHKGLGSSTAKW